VKNRYKNECPGPDPDPRPFPTPLVPDLQPQPPNPPTRPPIPHSLEALFAVICFSLLGGLSTGSAQIAPDTLPAQQLQQTPAVISPIESLSSPTSGISAKVITPATTNRLAPHSKSRSGTGLNGVARGLPGMPGGPPLASPLGARDPAAQFMRPSTIGPLFCDPAIDMSC